MVIARNSDSRPAGGAGLLAYVLEATSRWLKRPIHGFESCPAKTARRLFDIVNILGRGPAYVHVDLTELAWRIARTCCGLGFKKLIEPCQRRYGELGAGRG
jgi:hypothetical protein